MGFKERISAVIIILGIGLLSVLPMVLMLAPAVEFGVLVSFAVLSHAIGWFLVAALLVERLRTGRTIRARSAAFGVETRGLSPSRILERLLIEVERRHHSLLPRLFEKRLDTKEELSDALERIVARSYRLLNAESAELALFDKDSGLYHSSFVLGVPFNVSAQAVLSGATEQDSAQVIDPRVIVQPLQFGGTTLGTLRIGLRTGKIPTQGDNEIVRVLALQGGLALINAKYNKELIKLKSRHEESGRAKTGFLATLSHEIRGPLGIILNAVELVLDGLCGELTADQVETLRMVHSNGEHLLELINDVLDFAKVESGKITVDPVAIDVKEILADVVGVVRTQAESKSHSLRCVLPEEVLSIVSDRRHLRQILINLLTNAIKYTPEGGTIEVWSERAQASSVALIVRDTGVGIDDAHRSKVFAPFERIEDSYSAAQVGTGLGMPLSRKLAEANGGTIDFSSRAGEGSTFWLILPEASHTASREEVREQSFPEVNGGGDVVLLVSRDDGERNMVARFLEFRGFAVAKVSNSIEANEVLRARDVAVVVLDNNVTDKPGENIVTTLRAGFVGSAPPVVLVSSRAFVFDIERYLKAGIDRYLAKPIELRELAYVCRGLIDGTYEGSVVSSDEIERPSLPSGIVDARGTPR